jgi:hypothetical protein
MIKKLMFCLLTIVVISAKSQVKTTLGFINYFGDDPAISSVSSGIDGGSKVYTAGRGYFANEDIVVQCTDSTGLILWTYMYDNGGYDSPNKIRTDAVGNSYITGVSAGGATGLDMVLIVLDPTGAIIFTKRFDNGFNNADHGMDVVTDANGDIYVTCKTKNGSGYWNAVTLKYKAGTGALLWQHTYFGSGFDDKGICLTLANNQADAIIAGTTNNGSDADIVVYQLDASTGTQGWSKIIQGTNGQNDNVNAIILAGANIVIAGMTDNSGTDKDYTTAKIDASSGSLVFQKDYDFSPTDEATSLVRDSAGNIGVTGIVYNSGTSFYEYHTILYDSLGTPYWTHKEITNCTNVNVNPVIVCDTIVHHLYIVGEKQNASRDILVYQLTPGGNLGWERSIDRPLSNSTDVGTSIVVNGIGVLFISGSTTDAITGDYDMTTLKLTQTPVYFPPDYGTAELNDNNFVFQKNQGQLLYPNGTAVVEEEVGYYNQGTSPSYYFNNSKISHIVFDLDTIQDTIVRVDLNFLGSNPLAEIYPYYPIESKKHYFTTSTQGITDVRSYERLFIPEAYLNVDVHHYSNTSGLKTYFVFKTPGESMAAVRLQVEGANSTSIDADGNLIASTDLGNINLGALTAYQAVYNPANPNVPTLNLLTASWNSIGSNMYNFSVSGASPFWPVVVYVSKPGATTAAATGANGNLWWATYIGSQGDEQIMTNKVDAKDNFYIGGYTTAANYPTSVGTYTVITNNPSSVQYGIVNRFRNDGKFMYGTYYGGFSSNYTNGPLTQILDLAVDSLYSIYLVGLTTTNNMPVKTKSGAINFTSNSANSGGQYQNAFVAKLKPQGNALDFSSYYGGTGPEKFNCARYWNGQVYIGGNSQSSTIPLVSPLPNTTQYTTGSGMYMHLDTAGAIKHSTKMHSPVVVGDVDQNGNYYMLSSVSPGSTGTTAPVFAPAPSFYAVGFNGNWDWGLQRMTPNDSINWSTFIGGSGTDSPSGISIRDSVMALCGAGTSNDFPFLVAAGDSGQTSYSSGIGQDIQMMKFDINSGRILWAAYHGTNRDETGKAVVLDKSYNMFVTGLVNGSSALSTRMVNVPGYYNQNTYIGTDAVVLGYSSDNKKKWATFYGSLSTSTTNYFYDQTTAISVNNSGKLFISGMTNAKRNTLPLVKWNNVCYWDSLVADTYPSSASDGFIAMFETSSVFPVGIKKNSPVSVFNGLLLYPNPNNGTFNIRFTETPHEKININVVNIMGQKVFEQTNLNPTGNELGINLGELSKGIYLINISDSKSSRTIKFVLD